MGLSRAQPMSEPLIAVEDILDGKLFRAWEAQRLVAVGTGTMRREATPESALVRKIVDQIWEFRRHGKVPPDLLS